ncbi:hypothetical protein PMAYCL1PPCAC_22504, partial [Pristionchus mayeri]
CLFSWRRSVIFRTMCRMRRTAICSQPPSNQSPLSPRSPARTHSLKTSTRSSLRLFPGCPSKLCCWSRRRNSATWRILAARRSWPHCWRRISIRSAV